MSLSGSNPKGSSTTSGDSSQIAYQREGLAVGSDLEYRLHNNMPNYFSQASFGVYI